MKLRPWLGLFLALALFRAPFILTGHVQEDAYISWHCARNLAETGIYGFNLGERCSASTSHLYVFLSAAIMRLSGANFSPLILAFNVLAFLCGLFLIVRKIFPDFRRQMLLWALAGIMPVSLEASYLGMETSLLFLLLGLALNNLPQGGAWSRRLAGLALFLMPWARPDAIAFGGLILAWLAYSEKRAPWALAACLGAGLASLLLFNQTYFGSMVNQTILGKQTCYHPSHALPAVLENLREVFCGAKLDTGIFSPLSTRFFIPMREAFFAAVLLGFGHAWRRSRSGASSPILPLLVLLALLPAAAYAFGGVLYPWYFWASAIFGWLVLLALAVEALSALPALASRAGLALLFLGFLLLGSAQWALSLSNGTYDSQYLRGVGEEIGRLAAPGDALFLEPAGYIPFYAGIKCYDEVGLATPKVMDCQRRNGADWLFAFLNEEKPKFVLEPRGEIALICGAQLGSQAQAWFARHYKKIRVFHYDPAAYIQSPLLLRVCSWHPLPMDVELYQFRS